MKDICALILAAGLGSRLKSKTNLIPKSMIKVNGTPIIDYQIDALCKNNIKNIIIVVGYKKEILIEYLKKKWGDYVYLRFVKNEDYRSTNSGHSFILASNSISTKRYIHLNCDTIFTSEVLKELIDSKFENQIVINTYVNMTDNMEQVIIGKDNSIFFMTNKKTKDADGKAMGLAKFNKDLKDVFVTELLEKEKNGHLNENFYGIIREIVLSRKIYTLINEKYTVMDFNDSSELRIVEQYFMDKS